MIGEKSDANQAQAGFTLAEVLAAMLFMAIVIPVAIQGLRIASLAGQVADRKIQAARVAERVLNENLITTNYNKSVQNGVLLEDDREFRWTMQAQIWNQDSSSYAPRLLSVEVLYTVQNQDYSVRLCTLSPSSQQ